jgi:hypothetical protein
VTEDFTSLITKFSLSRRCLINSTNACYQTVEFICGIFRHGLSHTEVNILNDPALSFAVAYQQYQERMAKEMKELAAGEQLYMKCCLRY